MTIYKLTDVSKDLWASLEIVEQAMNKVDPRKLKRELPGLLPYFEATLLGIYRLGSEELDTSELHSCFKSNEPKIYSEIGND